ncbi:methyltransferase [Chloroflexi bacterium TSY]|nr:methyltransferase [Chloroflexi bacterium TSY]
MEIVAGKPILVLPQVLNPVLFRTGEFLVQTLTEQLIPRGSTVLDMGTGSGVGAIFAAQWARNVVAVDISPEAVRCARINTLLNCVEERVEVLKGDLFATVTGKCFDVVLFNPPYFRGEPQNYFERALYATDVMERFAAELGQYLTPDGYSLLLLSSAGDRQGCLEALTTHGFKAENIASRDLVSEHLTIYKVIPLANLSYY